MTIRVLHIIGATKIGGVELSLKQFLENALDKDDKVEHFLCANFSECNVSSKIGILNCHSDTENPITILLNAFKIAKFSLANKIDIIHSYNRHTTLSAIIAKKLLRNKIKTVSSISGIYNLSGVFRKFFNQWFLKTDCTIAPSECAKKHFIENYHIKNPNSIHVIYEGIDIKHIAKIPSDIENKNDINLSPDTFKIVMLARFSKIKGQQVLIEALQYLPKDLNYECFLIGPAKPKFEKYLYDLAQSFKVHVKILHSSDAWIFNFSDIVICPSIRAESFGRVAVEAGFLKKIAIVSASGGHLEIIKDNITGFFVKPSDAKVLAEKILFVKNLPNAEKNKIQNAAFDFVSKTFSIEKHVNEKLTLYKEMMKTN